MKTLHLTISQEKMDLISLSEERRSGGMNYSPF